MRRSDYTEADLSKWVERILSQKWEKVFVFFKHEEEAIGPKTANRFRELIDSSITNTKQDGTKRRPRFAKLIFFKNIDLMPRTIQIARVGKRKIELSNLEKVLYPDDRILKAEMIQYYLQVAPTILAHLKGRPLSLVRYPDGIDGERFFQKNKPEWAPEWIAHVVLGGSGKEEKVDYVIATEEASLVWLANLACIELHQMHLPLTAPG